MGRTDPLCSSPSSLGPAQLHVSSSASSDTTVGLLRTSARWERMLVLEQSFHTSASRRVSSDYPSSTCGSASQNGSDEVNKDAHGLRSSSVQVSDDPLCSCPSRCGL